ncbi:MAG: NADPH:quinone reductase [Acidobacteria bacterium]|jgi:NADPH2:quinone reductase|nr:MAG: NADPH:quinone reductase [Acidobacteriota bacterium]GIU82205.1 MAG: NADPH:quinone oxidoreductase [Pyrinomonadaceae bacterium]
MKAIVVRRFGEPEVMKLEEVPTPEVGASQVLVRIKAAGVNPVDTYIRSGIYPVKPDLPYTPGKDGAGVVEKVGEKVTKVKVGDRVFLSGSLTGTYAEMALCEEWQVHHLPERISFEQGAGIFIPYATAYRALFQKAKAKSGETVLIHGASGGVGIAAIQWGKKAGLKILGTAGSEEGKKLVAEQGADFVFDHSKENYLQEILEVADEGVPIILEMLANVNLMKDLDILAKHGRIVVIGSRGSLEFNPRATMTKDASIFGMSLFNASEVDMQEILNEIEKGLSEGFLNPVVGTAFPLEEAVEAHYQVIMKKAFGKIVLLP